MSESFIKKPYQGSHSALAGLGVLWAHACPYSTGQVLLPQGAKCTNCGSPDSKPPCNVCGKPYAEHGTYPTCATHPYSQNGLCGHVGIYADGTFTGVPCAGSECKNGCVAARGVEEGGE